MINAFDLEPHYGLYPYSAAWHHTRHQHIIYELVQSLTRDRIPDPPFSEHDYYG